jgi:23S rRNA (guanosine2251-2'-O)-methyltransferase
MAGNSQRRGRRTTAKKVAPSGSGGMRKAGLKGKGRTLPAQERPWHKRYSGDGPVPERTARKQERERQAAAASGRAAKPGKPAAGARPDRRSPRGGQVPEVLVGRNPVVEALRAHVPATALYVAHGIDVDDRVKESVRTAGDRGIALMEVSRGELDRLSEGALHQGIGLQVPPYAYLPFEDVLAAATEHPEAPLLVALDGVTDPRNLGAVIRSAAAFGAHGAFLPQRRAAPMTATAWRTSAGAAARLPVARVTNLTRALKTCQEAGFVVVGLDADGPADLYHLEVAVGPLVLVVGSEGRGLSRLVGATCDLRVAIPTTSQVESLNASVAAAVALSEVARRRAVAGSAASGAVVAPS